MKLTFALLCILFVSGCASNTYTYGTQGMDATDGDAREVAEQFIVGKPHRFLDASDWYWPGSLLAKLILWNHKIDSHEISDETIEALQVYMDRNELDDVQVLVNAYRPGVQWIRTIKNKEVGGGWRFTLGILSAIQYTVMPGRFFGGDHYNPYSNTISLYSDIPAVALHEGGHAKDSNSRKHKGLYAALYAIPGVPLYHEAVATNDTLSYLRDNCDRQGQKSAYRILHPAYGTYIGGTFASFTQYGEAALLAALPGHLTGAVGATTTDYKEGCPAEPNSAEAPALIDGSENDSATPTTESDKTGKRQLMQGD